MAVIIPALSVAEQDALNGLLDELEQKNRRNVLRAGYYDGKNAFRNWGQALPPSFAWLQTVLGWPAKAVDTLNTRCHLEGFVWAGVSDLSELERIWDDNRLALEAPQVGTSSLIHAVAWLAVTAGDTAAGEPAALITPRDALSGVGAWDRRRRTLTAFLSVVETDGNGEPTHLVLYFPAGTLICRRDPGRAWAVDRRPNPLGRVPVEPVVYKPRLSRPFGSSRISRAVMSMTDLAIRTVTRSEVSAELYSIPQRLIIGASESMFTDANGVPTEPWRLVFGRVLGIPADELGNKPEVVQLAQASQEPHVAQLRALAQMFAGETSIPLTSLGVSAEANPASADAYYASREDLISLAESTTDQWSQAWQRAMVAALQISAERTDAVPDEWKTIRARFRNPTYTSRASAADAVTKMVATHPWMAESDTVLELYGFDPGTLERLLADKREAQSRATVANLAAAVTGRATVAPIPPETP